MNDTSGRIAVARAAFGGVGIGLIVVGGVFALTTLAPLDLVEVALWLAAAVVLHDGVLAPLVVLVAFLGRGAAARIGPAPAAVARAAFVVAACCSLVVVPGIVVRAVGARNDTIHTVNYVIVLAIAWAAAVVIGITCLVWGAHRRARATP